MFDLDFSKLAVVGVVALVVIGPTKLPKVARTIGTLLGKAQRYVADVKAEVNRSMELEELQKMKTQMQEAAKVAETSIQTNMTDFENDWQATAGSITNAITTNDATTGSSDLDTDYAFPSIPPEFTPIKKNWRVKKTALPQWFKAKTGVRRQALSGAARVARYRPKAYAVHT